MPFFQIQITKSVCCSVLTATPIGNRTIRGNKSPPRLISSLSPSPSPSMSSEKHTKPQLINHLILTLISDMITIHSYTSLLSIPDHQSEPHHYSHNNSLLAPTRRPAELAACPRTARHDALPWQGIPNLVADSQLMSVMSTVLDASPGTPPPSPPPPPPGHRGCCTSGATLELVGAFTAVCLVLYGVILYMNYLYVRWSGHDGVHRTDSGAGLPARKRPAGGIDKAALAAMPVLRFKADANGFGGGEGDSPMECAVCLSAMQDGDAVRALPGCRHAFHVACVDAWLCTRATCPVCRARPSLPPPQQAPKAGAKVPGSSGRQPDLDLESQV